MADWFSKRMEALKTRASNMALTDWLAVGAVVAVGSFYYWRRSTRAHFNRMLASWRVELTDEERHVIAFVFHMIDRNHDLALDRREFRAFVESTPQISSLHKSMQLDAFSMLDTDDSGDLSLPEFELFFKAIKNLAGKDIATQLLNHFVETVKKKTLAAQKSLMKSSGDASSDSASGTAVMVRKSRAIASGSNEFEKAIMENVILPGKIGVKFDDVGSLEKEKLVLRELIIFPLRHPEFFQEGVVAQSVKGVLLFGPPGTGKTMLAKAVATECGATFINIGASSLGSKWYGESEKYAKAVFTVARKLAPSIIFIDEIDSLLQSRGSPGVSSVYRNVQTVLMTEWDGLGTGKERVIVMGATNRPFDLDEAILRRMPRRLLVDVPTAHAREVIVKKIMANDRLDKGVKFDVIAAKTKGYTGSDLHNLCREAAYIRIRERMDASPGGKSAESKQTDGATAKAAAGAGAGAGAGAATPAVAAPKAKGKEPPLRAVRMADFRKALKVCRPSVSEGSAETSAVREWNSEYGDFGMKNKHKHLSMYT